MNLAVERHGLPLADPFGISRGTAETAAVVLVELAHEGTRGLGGVAPSAYYGQDAAAVAAALADLRPALEASADPHAHQRLLGMARERHPDATAAHAALSTALADLAARDLGVACYRQWGLDPDAAPRTSYTVGIDAPARMAEKAAAATDAGYPILKVKLGTDDDRARFRAVREAAPDATVRVDANGAWDAATALERADWLAAAGVEFLEQPVPADNLAGLARVHREAPLPVAADEACVDAADVPAVADACDVVVVKVSKCGGLDAARAHREAARAHGLDAMLGCMVESWASLAPAWHLAPLFEYADLDGPLLLAADPVAGPPTDGARVDLAAVERGSGARSDAGERPGPAPST
ncbi:MAG: dipeptide epimerase [Haloarculaceae archaeon]